MVTGLVLAAMLVLGVQAGAPASASDDCSDHAFHTAAGEAGHLAANPGAPLAVLTPAVAAHDIAGHAKPDKRRCCCQACNQAAIIGISDDTDYSPLIRAAVRTDAATDPDQFNSPGLRRPPRSLPAV